MFGLLALGAGIWFSIEISSGQELASARRAFDSAPACTAKSSAPCRQTTSATVIDKFLYQHSRTARRRGLNGPSQPNCQIGVQVGADRYEVWMSSTSTVSSASACNSIPKGEVLGVVVYNGMVVLVDGRPTRDNPDWADDNVKSFQWLAGYLTLFGSIGAIFLGAKALAG